MARCKRCKTNIPEGTEYCRDCKDRFDAKTNESYLDSLLNSVKNNSSVESIYNKKNNASVNNNPDDDLNQADRKRLEKNSKPGREKEPAHIPDMDDEDLYRVDFRDMEDFDSYNFKEDLDSYNLEKAPDNIDEEIIIRDEDLFGESLTSLLKEAEENNTEEESRTISEETRLEETPQKNHAELLDEAISTTTVIQEEAEEPKELPGTMESGEELLDIPEDMSTDLQLDELLKGLQQQGDEEAKPMNLSGSEEQVIDKARDETEDMFATGILADKEESDFEPVEADQNDFLSLLGQISDEDASTDDIRAISDMLAGGFDSSRDIGMPSDVGEVFSDALTAVSSLNDYELEEASILGGIAEQEPKKKKRGKNKKGKDKGSKEATSSDKPKLSFFERLFGNVKDDNTAERFEEEQRKLTEPKAEKNKKAKGKKNSAADPEGVEEFSEDKKGKNKAEKKAVKKEKADKKKKTKEVIEVIDEIEEDPGRINRVGAAIIFFFFGMVAIILIIGTNMVTYTLSIQHATNYFNHRKYNQAYNEVYGVDIKDEDIGLYDRIQTVMFVNKQLNSYNNNYAQGKYPEALDSLLKGLSRYEKYIELATMLGIEADLDYVKSQILAELNNVFELTETEAMQILGYGDSEDYSLAIYDVVLEKFNN